MYATREEQLLYGSQVEIVKRGEDCTVYRLSGESGEVVMTSYAVFPGIRLIYNDVHAPPLRHRRIPSTGQGDRDRALPGGAGGV